MSDMLLIPAQYRLKSDYQLLDILDIDASKPLDCRQLTVSSAPLVAEAYMHGYTIYDIADLLKVRTSYIVAWENKLKPDDKALILQARIHGLELQEQHLLRLSEGLLGNALFHSSLPDSTPEWYKLGDSEDALKEFDKRYTMSSKRTRLASQQVDAIERIVLGVQTQIRRLEERLKNLGDKSTGKQLTVNNIIMQGATMDMLIGIQ